MTYNYTLNMQKLARISYYSFWTLLIYMPFHIFLSQWLSTYTGGLEVWKIGKDVALFAASLFTICLVFKQRIGDKPFWWLTGFTAVYAALHLLLWAFNADIYDRSAILGTIYNLRLPLFLLLGYGAALLNPTKFVFSSLVKIVIILGTVVAALGVLQYFLPKDLLVHFGYSLERGVRPAFFIDDHAGLPRIMSTLREPNALGAFLLVPIGALTALLVATRNRNKQLLYGGMFGLQALAVFLTFSRSAWLATALVVALTVGWQFRFGVWALLRRWWPALVVLACLVAAVGFMQRNSTFVKSYITHATPDETNDLDSNDYHWLFIKQGVEGIIDQPLGHGPGTAGLASIQNPKGSFLTENYYVQIGYELGVLGLACFVALNVWIYRHLLRHKNQLTLVLLTTFWGYILTNMLLHTWSNEAVAAQWWLLAGVGIAWSRIAKAPAPKSR